MEAKIVKFEDVALTVTPAEEPGKVWSITAEEAAIGYGVNRSSIRSHLNRHRDEIREGIEKGVAICNTPGGVQEKTVLFRDGVIKLGFFIKSERAKKFRQWATDILIGVMDGAQKGDASLTAVKLQADLKAMELKSANLQTAFMLVDRLEAQKAITVPTALAHKARLLKEMTGIDLMKAPMVHFENVPVISVEELAKAGEIGATVVPVVDKTGHLNATQVAEKFGYTDTRVIGAVARHVGVYQDILEGGERFGKKNPVIVGGVLKHHNVLYNEVGVKMLAEILEDTGKTKQILREEQKEKKKAAAKKAKEPPHPLTN